MLGYYYLHIFTQFTSSYKQAHIKLQALQHLIVTIISYFPSFILYCNIIFF